MADDKAFPAVWLEEVDSTNSEAARRAASGETGPVWICARAQSAGRGRRGRVWSTGAGDLAATLLLPEPKPQAQAAQAAFVAALAAADLVAGLAPERRVELKWPNDVLLDGGKVCGVLVESGLGPAGRWTAVGVGVNLAAAPAPASEDGPAPVALSGAIAPEDALPRLDRAFRAWLGVWREEGFAPVAAAWTARARGLGRPCTARLPAETVRGIAEGLEPDGVLRLRLADGTARRIAAGDVFPEAGA